MSSAAPSTGSPNSQSLRVYCPCGHLSADLPKPSPDAVFVAVTIRCSRCGEFAKQVTPAWDQP